MTFVIVEIIKWKTNQGLVNNAQRGGKRKDKPGAPLEVETKTNLL